MNVVDSRRYLGLRFGLSISASNFEEDARLTSEESLNRFVFQEASHILLEGGHLVLGHRWKPNGFMHHLASRARDLRLYQRSTPGRSNASPPILNVLAWPDAPPPDTDKVAHQMLSQGIMAIEQMRPANIAVENVDPDSELGKFCRIRALSCMRRTVVERSDVRICFGGASTKDRRRLPGIVEEVVYTIHAHKPAYISSALGGVSRVIADALLQRSLSPRDEEQFTTPPDMQQLMESFAVEYPYLPEDGPSSVTAQAGIAWSALDFIRRQDIKQLASEAYLTDSEYINLLTTADIDRALTLIATAIQRLPRPIQSTW